MGFVGVACASGVLCWVQCAGLEWDSFEFTVTMRRLLGWSGLLYALVELRDAGVGVLVWAETG